MTQKVTGNFYIEETDEHITLYINSGLSKRIIKGKMTTEKQLLEIMGWLSEMNVFSSFIYGKYVNIEDHESGDK